MTTPVPTIDSEEVFWLLAGLFIASLVVGLIVIMARKSLPSKPDEPAGSVVRSWIAISLVIGLLAFCGMSFSIDDSSLRSTLFGGLIASVGAAVAFYFSSKSADQARSDILKTATAISQGGTAPTAFTAASPPSGKKDLQYPSYVFVATGTPAPSYVVLSGTVPTGLVLHQDGTLRGTPTETGDSTFSVLAWNQAGAMASDEIKITITP